MLHLCRVCVKYENQNGTRSRIVCYTTQNNRFMRFGYFMFFWILSEVATYFPLRMDITFTLSRVICMFGRVKLANQYYILAGNFALCPKALYFNIYIDRTILPIVIYSKKISPGICKYFLMILFTVEKLGAV